MIEAVKKNSVQNNLELAVSDGELAPHIQRRIAGWQLKPRQEVSRQYTAFVALLRVLLPLVAVAMLLLLFLWPVIRPEEKIALPKMIPEMLMHQPRFSGADEKNRPYIVEATEARQVADRLSLVDLVDPKGQIELYPGQLARGQARMGRFDQETKRLWLAGDVRGLDGKGYSFVADELMIDIQKRVAWTDKYIKVKGPFGTVEGQGMKAFDGGKVIIFKGPARALITHPAETKS